MKSKFEKQLFKEAKSIKINSQLESIYSNIGYEMPKRKTKFWTKPKIATLTSILSVGIISAIVVPISLNRSPSYSESLVSLKFTSTTETTKSNKISLAQIVDENGNNVEEATFSFYIDKKFNIDFDQSFTLDNNSKIIAYGISSDSNNLNTYMYSLMDSAIDTGYVLANSTSGNNIEVVISAKNNKTKNKVKELIGSALINALSNKYIYANLVDLTNNATEEEIEKAKQLGIEIDKFILIKKINDLYGGVEYSLETLSTMSYEELVSLLKSFYKCNYETNIIGDDTRLSLDEIKANFEKNMRDSFIELDNLQSDIFDLQDALLDYYYVHHKKIEHKYDFIIDYVYVDELFFQSIENDLDYHQLAMIPHDPPKMSPYNPYYGIGKDEIVSLLQEKVDTSINEVSDVIKELIKYKEQEAIILKDQLNPNKENEFNKNIEDKYNNRYDEHHDNYGKHDGHWEEEYNDHYKGHDDYWR